MAAVGLDHKSARLEDIPEHGDTVGAERYCDAIQKLRHAICRKKAWVAAPGPYTSNRICEWLRRYGWEVVNHHPYSPDFAPSVCASL